MGNTGCLSKQGCTYNNNFLYSKCNACKDGYYLNNYSEKGKCFPCSKDIPNCQKWYFNETKFKPEGELCPSLYLLNKNTKECKLNECQEYPEISPGCVICNDNLEGYKSKSICQTCKDGYFKTKEGKCVYCRSEKYGGPACYKCGYCQDNKIICQNCFSIYDYLINLGITSMSLIL